MGALPPRNQLVSLHPFFLFNAINTGVIIVDIMNIITLTIVFAIKNKQGIFPKIMEMG